MINFIIIAAALLLLFWLAYTNYVAAVVLIAGLLPSYLLRFSIAGLPTNFLEAAIAVVFLAGLGQRAVRLSWREAWQRLPRAALILICLWLAASVFSTVISPHPRTSLGILKGWILLPLILGWIVYAMPRSHPMRYPVTHRMCFWPNVINSLLVSGVVVAVIGLAQIGQMDRVRSVYDVPNSLALFLVPLIVMSAWLALAGTSRGMYAAAAVIMFAALLATQSAAGLISAIITITIGVSFSIMGRIKRFFKKPQNPSPPPLARGGNIFILIGGTIFIVAASWLVLSQTGRLDYLLKTSNNDSYNSIDVRRQLWSISWELIKEHPVAGVGLGTFEPAYQQVLHQRFISYEACISEQGLAVLEKENRNKASYTKSYGRPRENRKSIVCIHPLPEFVFRDPHNWIISFWLNTGLLGLVSFIALNLRTLLSTNTSDVLSSNASGVLGVRLALLSILIFGLVDTIYWKNDLSALYWLLFSLLLAGKTEL